MEVLEGKLKDYKYWKIEVEEWQVLEDEEKEYKCWKMEVKK